MPNIKPDEIKTRLKRLREGLVESGVDALLVYDPYNIRT